MSVKIIRSEKQFHNELTKAGTKLIVAYFRVAWSAGCDRMTPIYYKLAKRFEAADFIKIDGDLCRSLVKHQGVPGFPTFFMYQNGVKIDRVLGADPNLLMSKIRLHYGMEDSEERTSEADEIEIFSKFVEDLEASEFIKLKEKISEREVTAQTSNNVPVLQKIESEIEDDPLNVDVLQLTQRGLIAKASADIKENLYKVLNLDKIVKQISNHSKKDATGSKHK